MTDVNKKIGDVLHDDSDSWEPDEETDEISFDYSIVKEKL